ncbi:MAG: hypothetical protein EXR72_00260 [Myxococcales bacterium]|nr:hypothetical protein [Myxococcales bacterium]
MPMRTCHLAIVFCGLFAACDNGGLGTGTTDGAIPSDLAVAAAEDLPPPPDLAPAPDLTPPSSIGQACPVGNECPMGMVCLDETFNPLFAPTGYCTKSCAADADCGGGAFCSPSLGGGPRFCLLACGPGDACPVGRVCTKRLAGFIPLPRPACLNGNAMAKDGSACTTYGDCNKNQGCLSNPFSLPGGLCVTFGCTVGNNATCLAGGDGVCIQADQETLCIDGCNLTADCRVNEGYTCTPFPNLLIKACLFPNAGAGTACKSDVDCGPKGSLWRCLTGDAKNFPGGYCGAAKGSCDPKNESACPFDSLCYDPTPAMPKSGDDFCARTCGSDNDCRKAEGYKCLLVDPKNAMSPKTCRMP